MSAKYTFLAWDTPIENAPLKLALLQLANNADDDGFSYYSISKMAIACGMSERTFIRKISELEKMEVLKVERRSNRPSLYTLIGDEMGVTLCHLQKPEVTECHTEVTECQLVGDRVSHDPVITPVITPESISNNKKFNFESVLLDLGVDQTVLSDWLTVRKKGKASNTETALRMFLSEVQKAGISVNEAVTISAGNCWKGFKAQWYFNIKKDETKTADILTISDNSKWEDGINDIF